MPFRARNTVVNVRMDGVDVFGYTENEKEAVIAYLQVNEYDHQSKTIGVLKKAG